MANPETLLFNRYTREDCGMPPRDADVFGDRLPVAKTLALLLLLAGVFSIFSFCINSTPVPILSCHLCCFTFFGSPCLLHFWYFMRVVQQKMCVDIF